MASRDPELCARILANARAQERERLRNLARRRWPEAAGEELEQHVDQLEREKLSAAGRRGASVVRTRTAQAQSIRAALDTIRGIIQQLDDELDAA